MGSRSDGKIIPKKALEILKSVEIPFFGRIYGVFLILKNYNTEDKIIYLNLLLPKDFPLEELIKFEIEKKLKRLKKRVFIDVIYFESLNELYFLSQ